ncbi:helix-turn-helix transcriptional regulator [Calorimonas adulescens]|jgi:transcriptional regulator with XRE-family HTH domain|uniref:Helix-turn-helix transcriptional regulator n=1 Tax=Calorimonas adulescens TaxID=2606906 RepID=A0A5D8QH98_9THEO|nr:helix-turn-helix transcriptional regulator [Calorimonas adulescens]TZE83574.1 helix-turn-helix transcriptional regulator [Calorimonas adulescens]
MKALELKLARMRKRLSQQDMADAIGKSLVSYSKKERGEVKFTPEEITIVSAKLGLTMEQTNDIFFDNNLPFRKSEDEASPQLP